MTTLKEAGAARALRTAAEKRAIISAHFAANPHPQTPREIAHMIGWSSHKLLPALKDAADRGLIQRIGKPKRISYGAAGMGPFKPPVRGRPAEQYSAGSAEATPPVTTAPAAIASPAPASPRDVVELVVAGVLVVIGRNPHTGRLRIQIEEV